MTYQMRDDRRVTNNDYEMPPYSRLFVVCSKHYKKDDLLPLFQKYGPVDDIYMPKDRDTGASKGIAFVKFNKTSSAAAAIEELHLKCIEKGSRPLKVMVSSNKSEEPHTNEEKFKRLFIKVPKNATSSEIAEHFSAFGDVNGVHLPKDKDSNECRGFAYVNFNSFLDAARAFEQCDHKYKPIFATPKEELKRPRVNFDDYEHHQNGVQPMPGMAYGWKDDFFDHKHYPRLDVVDKKDSITGLIETKSQNFDTVVVTCSPSIRQKCIEQLFNVIPGVQSFIYTSEFNECQAIIKYETEVAAAHAVETMNFYEFPSGEIITVKPMDSPLSKAASNLADIVNSFKNAKDSSPDMLQLAEVIAQASSLIKAATNKEKSPETKSRDTIGGVILPPIKPLANKTSKVAQRCFIVLKPQPPPQHILQNIFCRFGDLIDVSVLPEKRFGFAKYASQSAAKEAIATLNGTILYGVKFKVMEADDKHSKEDRMNVDDDDNNDHDMETKRAKLTT